MKELISKFCDNLKDFLLEKNRRYGNSALKPAKIFSKLDASDSILIRLDDKVNRVINNPDDKPRTNDLIDIVGYIALYLISQDDIDFTRFID